MTNKPRRKVSLVNGIKLLTAIKYHTSDFVRSFSLRGKIFIAFQYRGENLKEVEDWLNIIRDEVLKRKNDYFCSFWVEDMFQEKGYTDKQMYNYCLNKLDKCETVIFLLRSEKNSKGMIKELDHAVKKGKKIRL